MPSVLTIHKKRQIKEMMDLSIILDIVVMVTPVYAYVQMYQTVYIKYVQFIVY